jgi:Tfp pilus assembly protein PilO
MKGIDLKAWRLWRIDAAGAAVILAVTALVYCAGIRPTLHRRAHAAGDRARLRDQRLKCTETSDLATEIQNQLLDTQKALAKSAIQLQPASRVNQRVAGIADLATKTKLKIDDVRLGPSSCASRYTAVPITLAGTGTYQTCITFLHALNKAYPDTCVSTSDVSSDPGDPTGVATFKFDLLW